MKHDDLERRQAEMRTAADRVEPAPLLPPEVTETIERSTTLRRREILAKLYLGGGRSLEECAAILREQFGLEHVSMATLRADVSALKKLLKDNLKKTVEEARAEQEAALVAHLGYIIARHSREGDRYETYHKDFMEVMGTLMKLTGTASPEMLQVAVTQKREEDLSASELVLRSCAGLDAAQIEEVLRFAESLPRRGRELPWLEGEVVPPGER